MGLQTNPSFYPDVNPRPCEQYVSTTEVNGSQQGHLVAGEHGNLSEAVFEHWSVDEKAYTLQVFLVIQ